MRWRCSCQKTENEKCREGMIDEDETRLKSKREGGKRGEMLHKLRAIIVLTLLLYGSVSCETGKRSWLLSPPVGRAAGSEAEPEGWSELFPRQPTEERKRDGNSRRSAKSFKLDCKVCVHGNDKKKKKKMAKTSGMCEEDREECQV